VLVASGLLVALVVTAPAAGAHATLEATTPIADDVLEEPAREVSLRFDEAVGTELGDGIRVFGPDGDRVDAGTPRSSEGGRVLAVPVDDAGDGTYTVAWRVVSGDSHVLSGTFLFHVGEPSGGGVVDLDPERRALAWAGGVARWLVLTGASVAGGLALVRLVAPGDQLGGSRVARAATLAAAGLLVGAVARLVLHVAEAAGRAVPDALSLVGDAVTTTRTGGFDLMRIVAAVVVLGAALAWRRLPGRVVAPVAVSGAGLVALANTLGGHAWTVDRHVVAITSDLAHQAAVAVWVGGLVALAVAARPARPAPRPAGAAVAPEAGAPETGALAAGGPVPLASTVSSLALVAVAVVALTGTVSAWLQLGELEVLWSTAYGRVLVAKVAVFALMVALGWGNRARLADLVARRAGPMRAVRAEVVLAGAALALTAGLVVLVPGRELVARPYAATFQDDLGTVSVTVEPARTGANSLHVYFFDDARSSRPVDVAEARVSTGDLPPRRLDLVPIGNGHYSAVGFTLPTAGRWHFTITSVTRGVPAELDFEVPVR
jgi:copper transport protein